MKVLLVCWEVTHSILIPIERPQILLCWIISSLRYVSWCPLMVAGRHCWWGLITVTYLIDNIVYFDAFNVLRSGKNISLHTWTQLSISVCLWNTGLLWTINIYELTHSISSSATCWSELSLSLSDDHWSVTDCLTSAECFHIKIVRWRVIVVWTSDWLLAHYQW